MMDGEQAAMRKAAEMLFYAMGDPCPCNYTPTDEWLPQVCELQGKCPNPDGVLDCWMQFVKHFGERKDNA